MNKFRPYSEIEAEREQYPWGKPGPYQPGHKNYLAPDYDPMPHRPNRIPIYRRVHHSLIAIWLVGYGAYGLKINDIWLPGKRTSGAHFHGPAALLVFIAMCCGAASLVAVVVDHYDRRQNELSYLRFCKTTQLLGVCLLILGVVAQLTPLILR
jgi:hypothetical protein